MNFQKRTYVLTISCLLIVFLTTSGCTPGPFGSASTQAIMVPRSEQKVIVFADFNWTSAQIQNRIAQYLLEEGVATVL